MNTEIEIKAPIDDPERLKKALTMLPAQHIRSYDKLDIYFHLMKGEKLKHALRLRRDGDAAIVTLKDKQLRNGLEINAEREFTVSDVEHFIHLLKCSGYVEFIRKRKTGDAWRHENCLIELSLVEGLGHFIEVEALSEGEASEEYIHLCEKEIRGILTKLGIDRIEERSYTVMLAEKQGKKYPD